MVRSVPANPEIAATLERVADLLEAQEANVYRVRAYRTAAETIRQLDTPLSEILAQGGVEAVDELPTIGRTIASHIAELVHRGGLSLLERLEGEVSPERLLTTVPGIGPKLAERIHHELSVETLEELEVAAHDGRLERLSGFGPRRSRAVREALGSILARSSRQRARRTTRPDDRADADRGASVGVQRPDLATLLSVDAEYRDGAARGRLRCITPRRHNPRREAWLPILHVERGDWDLTALFSNTARAHELDRTRDWVVIYYARDGDEGQCTVVTERSGDLRGRRVVRGREAECRAYYAEEEADADAEKEAEEEAAASVEAGSGS